MALGQAIVATVVIHEETLLAVPAIAVLDSGGEETDLVAVRDGKTAVLHPKLGLKDEGWIAVSYTDLKAGEPVVVKGGYGLDKDVEVEIEKDESAEEKPAPGKSAESEK